MSLIFGRPPTLCHAVLKLSRVSWQTQSCYMRMISRISNPPPGRTYADAIVLLDTLQSNRSVVASISDSSPSAEKNEDAIPEMINWIRKAGYNVSDFASLKYVHVAGTKGKGSVCAMVENIFLQYQEKDLGPVAEARGLGKVGLYTSPHLVTPRERIRIDGVPIPESLFAQYFFELWDRFAYFASTTTPAHHDLQSSDTRPGYFRYLTLMALHVFKEEKVETAIVECGIGGEYDSTNILPVQAVSVSAITKLGVDHVGMLGKTIREIAWHKAGIMRESVPVFSVQQLPEAKVVLDSRAREKNLVVEYVKCQQHIMSGRVSLGLDGEFQKDNASLAIAVAASHLRRAGLITGLDDIGTEHWEMPEKFAVGLKSTKLQARCEVRHDGNIEWLIDGAHTTDSMIATARWYSSRYRATCTSSTPPSMTILIFNQQDRDASSLLSTLLTRIQVEGTTTPGGRCSKPFRKEFTYAAFCRNTPFKDNVEHDVSLEQQKRVAETYQKLDGNPLFMCFGSVEEAVYFVRKVANGEEKVLVLVTGSLHLAGGLIEVLDSREKSKQSVS